jgi:hypothetical protein
MEVVTAKPATKPAPPTGLALRGRTFWRQVVDRYALNPAEQQILWELCRTLDVLDELNAERATADAFVKGSEGQPRPHPVYAMIVESQKIAVLLSRRLALPDDMAREKRTASAVVANKARWQGVS